MDFCDYAANLKAAGFTRGAGSSANQSVARNYGGAAACGRCAQSSQGLPNLIAQAKRGQLMATIIMDTYDYAARLKASGFSEEQAAGQTKALAEILEKQMASKLEMDERDNRLRQDIAQARQDIEKAELKLEAKIDAKIAEVHTRIAETKTDTIKWMIGLLVAQTGLIIGVMMKLMHP